VTTVDGWPVVDDGADYLIPAPEGVPTAPVPAAPVPTAPVPTAPVPTAPLPTARDPTAEYRRLTAPTPRFREECYEHAVVAEPGGTVPVAVVNRGRGLGVYQVYRRDQFPFHTMWRMLGEGAYAVAMEPTTNRDAGRFDARERGELRFLDPGESRRYDLEIGALDGADAIDAFDARVRTALHGSPGHVGGRVAG
jgi:Domain of unknown function (DUF4432)